MRVLVTRPAPQAHEWVDRLRRAGVDAHALPLIGIAPPDDAQPVVQAWRTLSTRQLVFFVSPNAVTNFFALRPSDVVWPQGLQAASPGPGTTRALVDVGIAPALIVEPQQDAPQFDSESLWQRLSSHDWHGARVIAVRGTSGRDWLAERLREAGAEVEFVSAYRRMAPILTESEHALLQAALAAPASHLWFFSSSEAIEHLQALAPSADWSASQALATHPRIALNARQLGYAAVHEARPAFHNIVEALVVRSACIQSRAS
jgi:uroporphyrinogen-III synthase